jgi:hypothetical protein
MMRSRFRKPACVTMARVGKELAMGIECRRNLTLAYGFVNRYCYERRRADGLQMPLTIFTTQVGNV